MKKENQENGKKKWKATEPRLRERISPLEKHPQSHAAMEHDNCRGGPSG